MVGPQPKAVEVKEGNVPRNQKLPLSIDGEGNAREKVDDQGVQRKAMAVPFPPRGEFRRCPAGEGPEKPSGKAPGAQSGETTSLPISPGGPCE